MAGSELARRVAGVTGGLLAVVAVAAGWLGGAAEALGVLAGGGLALANFLWLDWSAGAALRDARPPAARWRRALWLVGSGARLGVTAVGLGWVVVQGGVGLLGLLVALVALPIVLVAEGLRAARTA